MIIGSPFEFAFFYDFFADTESKEQQYGVFNFFIKDIIYPAKTGNYRLSDIATWFKDCYTKILNFRSDHVLPEDNKLAFKLLSHSSHIPVYSDQHDMKFTKSEPAGILLSSPEIQKDGFYLYYYCGYELNEYLIYSMDCGKTVEKSTFIKGTVLDVITDLLIRPLIKVPFFETSKITYKANSGYNIKQDPEIETDFLIELFKKSIPVPDKYRSKKTRYATDSYGNLHRFDGAGGYYYWNGSSNSIKNPLTENKVPVYIQDISGVKLT